MEAAAESAKASQVRTWSAYTPGRNREAIPMSPAGRPSPHRGRRGLEAGRAGGSGQGLVVVQPSQGQVEKALGSRRLRPALQVTDGRDDTTGLARSAGKGVSRSSAVEAGMRWRAWEKEGACSLAASHAA